MIVCPNCNHQNPEGSLQCENCYTPLPASANCPNCGASVQTDATFCGQCGFNLQAENLAPVPDVLETIIGSSETPQIEEEFSPSEEIPETSVTPAMSSPIASPWDEDDEDDLTIGQIASSEGQNFDLDSETEVVSPPEVQPDLEISLDSDTNTESMPWEIPEENPTSPNLSSGLSSSPAAEEEELELDLDLPSTPASSEPATVSFDEQTLPPPPPSPLKGKDPVVSAATQLQLQRATLVHVQTATNIEISPNLDVIHIGKPNSQIPPDVDVAGFPDSEVVSRIHADIRVEGDAYFIEDTGSSNGTYINHTPLLKGNRHRLRAGDRISLGKGDLVTFIFQLS